jgi:hypothetical protein
MSTALSLVRADVRLAEEDAKPNAEWLREYADAGRASLEQALYSAYTFRGQRCQPAWSRHTTQFRDEQIASPRASTL